MIFRKVKLIVLPCVIATVLMLTGCASVIKDMQDVVNGSVGIGFTKENEMPVLGADVQLGFVTHPALSTSGETFCVNYGWRNGDHRGSMLEFAVSEPWMTIAFPKLKLLNLSYAVSGFGSDAVDIWNRESRKQYFESHREDLLGKNTNLDTKDDDDPFPPLSTYKKLGAWLPIPLPDIPSNINHPFTLRELTNFNAGVHLGFITLRAGVNPLEFVELVFSLFGLGWDELDRIQDDDDQQNP